MVKPSLKNICPEVRFSDRTGLLFFAHEDIHTGCPNKHGNSVTNSISSF